MITKSLDDKINQIIKFALDNGNEVSYTVVADVLKDKEDHLSEIEMSDVLRQLINYGIAITPEKDEEYIATDTEPENFIPADVAIGQRTINIYNLMERLEHHEIDLEPSFQRKGNLWSLEQQSRLIESLMLKIPIPAFYFNAADDDSWIVIDGLQRLTAFLNFLVGRKDDRQETRIKQKFVGLQYLKDFNDHTFDDLPRQYMRRIKETSIIAYTVEKGTPDEIVFNIFQRINTGGIMLNAQEIRQALYQGESTKLIERLAKCEEFLEATEHSVRKDRMQDREYITRFLAFTEMDYRSQYAGNIDDYLIKAMKLVNTYNEQQIDKIENNFKYIMKYCKDIFGRYAFRRYNENKRRGPINKALFEMWAVCFSELTEEQLEKIKTKRKVFLERFGELQKETTFINDLKAGDQYAVEGRIRMARNLIKEILC